MTGDVHIAEAPETSRHLRVALVHDWLTGMRGGEKVLEVLCTEFPHADLFTLIHVPGRVSPTIEGMRPRATVLSRLPGVRRYYRHLLPLFPAAVEQIRLDAYDLVISTSHCAVKSVIRRPGARHICYCHTPMRYVWDQRDAYFGPDRVGRVGAAALRPILAWLARWDAATADRVDAYIANSQYVADRIRRYYNRRAFVVHPPVDTEFFTPDLASDGSGALVVSALVPYKRIEVAIDACRRAQVPLRIVGQGPDEARLRAQGGSNVTFLGAVSNEAIRDEFRRAAVVLLPGEEDFGIVPVEAQACGRPVVALGRGGALETVVDGTTGVLVREDSAEAFGAAIRRAIEERFDVACIRHHAERFGRERFVRELREIVARVVTAPANQTTW